MNYPAESVASSYVKAGDSVRSRERRGVDPGLLQDLPHGGGGDLDPEHEQLAVDSAVPPARILP